ncbi:tripartite tricarboxylate transporter substrate binding protein [Achromobacter sp. GG226]|uniref:Bug family tripartite tricarboxylate transporter substrate binding protein n=1 Tax=Verticiella alkaliphila TaxID=2779529 RepID=UPI001C0D06CA|nr:tripartite tricarboxylate transporter substrate binding protein [Verticiella sp. GG226]MBU4612527.1 tripartite tricarboxylate transporter substrate binding protein [Verticiella sp. GG226]
MHPTLKQFALTTLATLAFGSLAQAASYPDRPITLVNPYAVGGPADQLARVLAQGLGEQLGQSVIVENKAGGGASIGAGYVAKAPADGYTLLFGTSAAHVTTPAATQVPYQGIQDFAFIGIVANVPNILTVHPSVQAQDLPGFIALAKQQPGKISYASAGLGSSPHIGMEMFKAKTGTELQHIPYRGAAPAATDLVAGTVQVGMLNISGVQAFVNDKRLRALAYGGQERAKTLPDVPTFAEAGLADFVTGSWYSLAAPAGTPQPVIDRLAQALATVQGSETFTKAAAQQSAEIYRLSPAETLTFVQKDLATTQDLIKTTGMKLTD